MSSKKRLIRTPFEHDAGVPAPPDTRHELVATLLQRLQTACLKALTECSSGSFTGQTTIPVAVYPRTLQQITHNLTHDERQLLLTQLQDWLHQNGWYRAASAPQDVPKTKRWLAISPEFKYKTTQPLDAGEWIPLDGEDKLFPNFADLLTAHGEIFRKSLASSGHDSDVPGEGQALIFKTGHYEDNGRITITSGEWVMDGQWYAVQNIKWGSHGHRFKLLKHFSAKKASA